MGTLGSSRRHGRARRNDIGKTYHRSVAGFLVHKELKDHGTERKIDGNFKPDSNVVLFDDVTKGDLMLRSRATARRLEA